MVARRLQTVGEMDVLVDEICRSNSTRVRDEVDVDGIICTEPAPRAQGAHADIIQFNML